MRDNAGQAFCRVDPSTQEREGDDNNEDQKGKGMKGERARGGGGGGEGERHSRRLAEKVILNYP